MADPLTDAGALPEPQGGDERLQLILDGLEQLLHRIADVTVRCDALAHGIAGLAQRLDGIERRLDGEMLRRVEQETGEKAGPKGRGVPGLPEPLDSSVKG